jgi:hypothetical protein
MIKRKKAVTRDAKNANLPGPLQQALEKHDRSHMATSIANEALNMGASMRDALAMVHANVEECRRSMN